MPSVAAIAGLDAASYPRHLLHASEGIWTEKNCYVDVWIELVHALKRDPLAMLPFAVAIDFEGDQWTFFKPSHADLWALYGLDVQELYVWRPLLEHAVEHCSGGKLISTEADAWWLPDTLGTDYRSQHTKTTIIINSIDVPARSLGYFHNAGYFTLGGEDFERLFRLNDPPDPAFMPLYAEFIRQDRLKDLSPQSLRRESHRLLRLHLERCAPDNPIRRFQLRFERDLPALREAGLGRYHVWAFGTLRQLGAAAELAAHYLRWLAPGEASAMAAAESFRRLSGTAKVMILKAARAVNARRPLDAGAIFDEMAADWAQALSAARTL